MTDLRVPTVSIQAEVLLVGGERLAGRLHLPVAAADHPGPPSLGEWLNETGSFFPFQPNGTETHVILNKNEILSITAPADASEPETPGEIDLPQRTVSVELDGFQFNGAVTVDMPPEQSRLLDVLNRPETFLTLHAGAEDHVVNKSRIARASESI